MTEFNPLKQKLTKSGKPWMKNNGVPRDLKEGETNTNGELALYNHSQAKSQVVVVGTSNAPSPYSVADVSVVNENNVVEQRLITDSTAIAEMQDTMGEKVFYEFWDRRTGDKVKSSYDLTEILNRLDNKARERGVVISVERGEDILVNLRNAVGHECCLNVSQPPATLERHMNMFIMKQVPQVNEAGGYRNVKALL